MTKPRLGAPDLGIGVGLRVPHYNAILKDLPQVDWFECISENFMIDGGKPMYHLDAVREHYPMILHGVSMNLGSSDDLDAKYLKRLRALIDRVNPAWFSDHLCWGGVSGVNLHDLLPLPMTKKVAHHVADHIKQVQDEIGRIFVIENVSSYLTYRADEMPEWDFVSLVAETADCGLLFDVNNIYVSSRNHGFDPRVYVENIPHERVVQMHLAGHTDKGNYILDTHSDHVCPEVWELYRLACEKIGPCSTLIEWDDNIPELDVLLAEAELAKKIRKEVCGDRLVA
jgi:uncharacterized protein